MPLVELAYNNTVHTAIGKVPFQIVQGGKIVLSILHTKYKIFESYKFVENWDEAYKKVKQALQRLKRSKRRPQISTVGICSSLRVIGS